MSGRNVTWQQLGAIVGDGEKLTDAQLRQFARCAGRWITPVVDGENWNTANFTSLRDRAKREGLKVGLFLPPGCDAATIPFAEADEIAVCGYVPHLAVGDWREALEDWALAVALQTPEQVEWEPDYLGVHALLSWNSAEYLQGATEDPVNQIKRAKAAEIAPLVHGLLGVEGNDLRVELLDVLEAKLAGYGLGVVLNGLEHVSDFDEQDPYGRGGQWKLLAAQAGRLWLP